MPETRVVAVGVEGIYVDVNAEGHHEREQSEKTRSQSDLPGEEGEENLKARREKLIRVESEETQDHVREAKDTDQEEAEETEFRTERDQLSAKSRCFVGSEKPSALGSWRR